MKHPFFAKSVDEILPLLAVLNTIKIVKKGHVIKSVDLLVNTVTNVSNQQNMLEFMKGFIQVSMKTDVEFHSVSEQMSYEFAS